MIDISQVRSFFPVTEEWIYFDHAAVGPLATPVVEAVQHHLATICRHGCAHHDVWDRVIDETRSRAATLIGCRPDEIALTTSTSEGANIVAKGLEFQRGDNIVVPDKEFPANLLPWKDLEQDGVEVREVPLTAGRISVERLLQQVDHRTALVAVSSVAYHNGYRIALEDLGRALAEHEIPLYVDAIQSLGVLSVDVERCAVSFLSADSHKWLMGLEGAALFYCRAEMLPRLRPPFVSWRSVEEPFNFQRPRIELAATARRFEYGAYNLAGICALNATLKLILEVGIDAISQHVLRLTDRLVRGLHERGMAVLSPRAEAERSGIVTFRYTEGQHDYTEEVVRLREKGIIVSARGGGIRVSPHLYNTEEEIDTLLEALP